MFSSGRPILPQLCLLSLQQRGQSCSRGLSQCEAGLRAGHRESYRQKNLMAGSVMSYTCTGCKFQIIIVTPAPSELDKISIFHTCQIIFITHCYGKKCGKQTKILKVILNYVSIIPNCCNCVQIAVLLWLSHTCMQL